MGASPARLAAALLVLEDGDHLPAGFDDQRVEGLFEAGLLDCDRLGQPLTSRRQRFEDRLLSVGQARSS
jgi:hypothetical protein